MKFSTFVIALCAAATAFAGCSSSQDVDEEQRPSSQASQSSPEPQTSPSPHDLDSLPPELQEVIVDWYEGEEHGDELRTLSVIEPVDAMSDSDGPATSEATGSEIVRLELLERRENPDLSDSYCYEGVLYLDIRGSEITSTGRYGHDCCPGIECKMGPENWMGRLFDASRDGDMEGLRQLIDPEQGLTIEETAVDTDADRSDTNTFHLAADEFPGERGETFMTCDAQFMAGFEFSCQDNPQGFSCVCQLPGSRTEFQWQSLEDRPFLVAISRSTS